MSFIDPRFYLADPQVRPFVLDQRIDLVAGNAPITATGKFVVLELEPPRGQVYVIKNIVPYAMWRTNVAVGSPNESFEMIPSPQGAGVFSFEPLLNDNSPFIIEQDYNAPKTAGGTLNNDDRQRGRGISYISDTPMLDASNSWFNPLFSILVPSKTKFTIVFSILPPPTVNPLPAAGRWGVGGVGGTKRVDFAGAVLVGQQMTEQYYHGIAQTIATKPE